MSAEPAAPARGRRTTNPVKAIVVLTVVAAFIAFEIWFFFVGGPVTEIRGVQDELTPGALGG